MTATPAKEGAEDTTTSSCVTACVGAILGDADGAADGSREGIADVRRLGLPVGISLVEMDGISLVEMDGISLDLSMLGISLVVILGSREGISLVIELGEMDILGAMEGNLLSVGLEEEEEESSMALAMSSMQISSRQAKLCRVVRLAKIVQKRSRRKLSSKSACSIPSVQ